jgi:hypothetical protein
MYSFENCGGSHGKETLWMNSFDEVSWKNDSHLHDHYHPSQQHQLNLKHNMLEQKLQQQSLCKDLHRNETGLFRSQNDLLPPSARFAPAMSHSDYSDAPTVYSRPIDPLPKHY